jgi:hypothetical protein
LYPVACAPHPDDVLGAFGPIQTDRNNFTLTATLFASAKLERRFSSSTKNTCEQQKKGWKIAHTLDDPNELVPNFNRYVIRAICSSNAKRSIIPKTF